MLTHQPSQFITRHPHQHLSGMPLDMFDYDLLSTPLDFKTSSKRKKTPLAVRQKLQLRDSLVQVFPRVPPHDHSATTQFANKQDTPSACCRNLAPAGTTCASTIREQPMWPAYSHHGFKPSSKLCSAAEISREKTERKLGSNQPHSHMFADGVLSGTEARALNQEAGK